MINIVLCGGSGTRLWPISRKLYPKQFLKLFDNESLFQKTIKRNQDLVDEYLVVSNIEQYSLSSEQINTTDVQNYSFILESMPRNTAPAIAIASLFVDEDEIVLVTPSDHLIKDEIEYNNVIKKAKEFAKDDYIVTFGITPKHPETGYGYIEYKEYEVLNFLEKPDKENAQKYINQGNFLWNSGIFCFKAKIFLEELKKYSPEVYNYSLEAYKNISKGKISTIDYNDMIKIPDISVDYAVMEKSDKIKVVPSDIQWSDMGSFDSLYDELPKDDINNSKMDHLININSTNNLIISDKIVSTIDVSDLIIIDTEDALLVSKRGSSQKIKDVVSIIKEKDPKLLNDHRKAHRPWGNYKLLDTSNGYKIKRIEVKPGCRLSLQKHFHRSEHWIVVSGIAKVTIDDKEFLVRPNESTYIKIGQLHRLENPGKLPLVLIEAQVGEYTGEDDIVRVEDDFSRT